MLGDCLASEEGTCAGDSTVILNEAPEMSGDVM